MAKNVKFGVRADYRCIYFMLKISIVVRELNSQIVSNNFQHDISHIARNNAKKN
jgi:hypothetical protein